MNTADILSNASRTFAQRGEQYGDVDNTFAKASIIASASINKNLSSHDIAMVLMAVKMARISNNPAHLDSYEDMSVYSAIAGQLSPRPQMPKATFEGLREVADAQEAH